MDASIPFRVVEDFDLQCRPKMIAGEHKASTKSRQAFLEHHLSVFLSLIHTGCTFIRLSFPSGPSGTSASRPVDMSFMKVSSDANLSTWVQGYVDCSGFRRELRL